VFIEVSERSIRKVISKGYELLWLPVALLKIPISEEVFVIDCHIHAITNSPLSRLLLIKKINEKRLKILTKPSVQAPKLERLRCSLERLVEDLEQLQRSVSSPTSPISPERSWTEYLEPWRIMLSHVLSPIKQVLGPLEKISSPISGSILRSLIEDMLSQLRIYELKGGNVKWINVHLLSGICEKRKEVKLLIGNKLIKSEVHAKYIFEVPEVYNSVFSALSESQ